MQRTFFSNWCNVRKYIYFLCFVICKGFYIDFSKLWIFYHVLEHSSITELYTKERVMKNHESSHLILVLVVEVEHCCPWIHIFMAQRENFPWGLLKSQVGKHMSNLKIQIKYLNLGWINLGQHMESYKKSASYI